jgi:hypothetical protein
VLAVGGVQDAGAAGLDGCGGAVVDVGGGVQAEAGVAVLWGSALALFRVSAGHGLIW